MMLSHKAYMRRALELAALARWTAHPNPMVGAVIVAPGGRIIGEGFHRECGQPHAEVNAMESVSEEDRHLIASSTIYVTLEPCAHQGRTPSCARMLASRGIGKVVVGCLDPFPLVSGKGIAILREAGIEVETGVLEEECRALNRVFLTAQGIPTPFITLKWAQTADGFLDRSRSPLNPEPLRISTPLTSLMVDSLRSENDAVMVGSGTVLADNPGLTIRRWSGKSPVKVVVDRRRRVSPAARLFSEGEVVWFTSRTGITLPGETALRVRIEPVGLTTSLSEIMARLRTLGIGSVLVEGGATLLQGLIDSGLWHEARIETSTRLCGENGTGSVKICDSVVLDRQIIDNNLIVRLKNPHFSGI